MNAALLTWTVALGGWILPEVGVPELDRSPQGSAAAPRVAASDLHEGALRAPARAARNDPAPLGRSPNAPRPQASPYAPRAQAPAMSPSHAARQQMPPVPTAPAAGFPQSPGHYGPHSYGSAGARPGAPQNPYAPTGAPGMPSQQQRVQPARIGAGMPGIAGGAGNIVKPFSDYRQLPVVSPYLNLERSGGLDFDNYNTLVRPFVDQYQQNFQVQNELQQLQNTINQQHRALQQLNRPTDLHQGGTQPQHFQNTGEYFPNR